ncbi:sensor histidine kinase [Streptomyces olivaceiscleroticus]|uniref:histidine kinase n=1 Tax=Streptomyces olivaceiscleroticus TaxID=68245 RepID=A0ABN0ZKG0_9ACTN
MEHSDDVRRAVPAWLLPGDFLAGGDRTRARRTPRDWAIDSLTFGAAVVLGLVVCGIVQQYDRPSDWLVAVDLLLGGLACVSLWWRRSAPLVVALLALPAVAVSSSALPAGFVITVNLALRLPWRRSLLVLGLYLAASLLGTLLVQGFSADGMVGVAFALAYYLVAFACGSTLRARRLWALAVRREADLERADHARRLADTRRTERAAIAREMHDVLAHRISLLSVHAGALAYRAKQSAAGSGPGLDGTEISDSAQIIRDNAHQALGELHDVLLVLRTGDGEPTAPQPRLADVSRLVEEARAAGQDVDFHDDVHTGDEALGPEASPLRPQLQRTVYRVVQEGLTNARKHAPGAKVTVRLAGRSGSDLTIVIANRVPAGVRTPDIPGTGAGLTGLAERVRLDGGLLEHGEENGTFTLRATLPWAAE